MEEELLKYCKYFGTDDGYQRNTVAYFYEKKWVSLGGDFPTDSYKESGLSNFNSEDGVPISLKALLLDRFLSSNGFNMQTVELFKMWYLQFYLSENKND